MRKLKRIKLRRQKNKEKTLVAAFRILASELNAAEVAGRRIKKKLLLQGNKSFLRITKNIKFYFILKPAERDIPRRMFQQ